MWGCEVGWWGCAERRQCRMAGGGEMASERWGRWDGVAGEMGGWSGERGGKVGEGGGGWWEGGGCDKIKKR